MSKKILVIDDSALMRRVMSDIIKTRDEYQVAAIAKDGVEGFELIVSNPTLYDAIILDINMPRLNGLELLEKLQKNRISQTVIVVSTVAKEGAKETIRALELGAFDFVTKPENYIDTRGDDFKGRLLSMLDVATSQGKRVNSIVGFNTFKDDKKLSEKKTTEKSSGDKISAQKSSTEKKNTVSSSLSDILSKRKMEQTVSEPARIDTASVKNIKPGKKKIVALACSTGGPKSLQRVIPYIPADIDAPIVLVQHMPKGFTASLAQRLNEMSKVKVVEAKNGEEIVNGCVYIAPGGFHMEVTREGGKYKIKITDDPPVDALKPCANKMYASLENTDYDEITCVVLTGMGADGTKGIQGLSRKKKVYVIAQDEETSVVYGMPKAIKEAGMVNEVKPLDEIAATIIKNVGVS